MLLQNPLRQLPQLIIGRRFHPLQRQHGRFFLREAARHRQIFQWKLHILVKHRTAGKPGAVAAGADDRGTDGAAAQHKFPAAQAAAADGLPQLRSQIAEGQPWLFLPDAVRHTAGKGNDSIIWRYQL